MAHPKQYKDGYLLNIQRKGKEGHTEVACSEARQAGHRRVYRGRTRAVSWGHCSNRRMAIAWLPQNVDDALKKIAAQANSTLTQRKTKFICRPICFAIPVFERPPRKDIRYAMKLSGHTSSQYIWRYTEPSATEFDQALEDLYD